MRRTTTGPCLAGRRPSFPAIHRRARMKTTHIAIATLVGVLVLSLAALGPRVETATTQQLPEPTDHAQLSPCFAAGPAGAGGVLPAPPAGLTATLLPPGAPNAGGVTLTWQPVVNAACVAIEATGPGLPDWTQLVVVPAGVTQTVVNAVSVAQPGTYCFGAVAATTAGRSASSPDACVTVGGATVSFAQGWNLVSGLGGAGTVLSGA